MTIAQAPRSPRRLDFRSGGWVLLLMAMLVLSVAAWRLAPVLLSGGGAAIGDRRDPNTYGFDLSNLAVPSAALSAALAKDGLRALVEPATIDVAGIEGVRLGRGPFLTADDRVIGVALGGEARCYPLRILIWHEAVNDVVGGEPIAVTYSPLTDCAAVFSRRRPDATLEFGVSGLLYNSNLLMFDRQPHAREESLWSQIRGDAVAGPSVGSELDRLPAALTTWAAWRAAHPQTRVLQPDATRMRLYRREAYSRYVGEPALRFPVFPALTSGPTTYKQPWAGVWTGGGWRVAPVHELVELAQGASGAALELDGVVVRVESTRHPLSVWLRDARGETLPLLQAYRFAWESSLPQTRPLSLSAAGTAPAP